jgi:hypothetical protein
VSLRDHHLAQEVSTRRLVNVQVVLDVRGEDRPYHVITTPMCLHPVELLPYLSHDSLDLGIKEPLYLRSVYIVSLGHTNAWI